MVAVMSHKQSAEHALSNVESELRAISRWLYENPETAYQEFESSRKLADYLATQGFVVSHPAYGLETAFEATVGTGGPPGRNLL